MKITNKKSLIYILVVMLLCVIPSVGMIFRPTTESIGNVVPAAWPSFTDKDGKFNANILEDMGQYFGDRFAYRAEMVSADSAVRAGLFQVSSQESVIVGDDGWLYYEATLDDFMHRNPVSARTLMNEARNMVLMQEYTELLGKQFLFTIAPNKNSLYGEHMPVRYQHVFAEESDASRLIPYLEAEGVHYVDLYGLFRGLDGEHYYKRDSHWDETGAVAVYNALLDAAGLAHETYVDVVPAVTTDYVGDLAKMLYPATAMAEPEPFLHYIEAPGYEMLDDETSVEANLIHTVHPAGSGRLLMYRDSFGNSLLPYMAQHFEAAAFSKIVPYNMTDLVNEAPDLVIVERVERHLPTLASVPPSMNSPERFPILMGYDFDSIERVSMTDCGLAAPQVASINYYWQITGSLSSALADAPALCEDGRIYLEITDISGRIFYIEPFYVTLGNDDACYQANISQFVMADAPVSVVVIAETADGFVAFE